MAEAAKRILAYQRSPLVLTCEQSGEVPEDFLSSLTDDEREYVLERSESPLEPVFYDLLPNLGAAGVLPGVSGVLIDVHRARPRVFTNVDGIGLPLMDEPGTPEFLAREFFEPFVADLKRVLAKSEQRFGASHLVHLALLPRFVGGSLVEHDIVAFGEPILEGAAAPAELRSLYEGSLAAEFPNHTWIGVNRKFFSTPSLTAELVDRLARLRDPVLATQ